MAVKIKICGITNLKDAQAAVKFGADALGFILAPSPRQISLNKAKKIIKILPPFITTVAVVVNENKNNLNKIINEKIFNCLQLHGEEKPGLCRYLKNKINLIKTIRIKNKGSLKNIYNYNPNAFLFDTFSNKKHGGTGETFSWDLVKQVKKYPIILSGGLNPSNVSLAIKKVNPYAVDTCSGVEKCPGKKNLKVLKKFIGEVKKNNRIS